jgi:hypothetical protein
MSTWNEVEQMTDEIAQKVDDLKSDGTDSAIARKLLG